MAETITITQPETGPEAPQEVAQDNQSERPEWLPEKFKSPEDLAKSYTELEKKLSQPSDDEAAEPEAEANETEQSPAPQFDKYAEEFATSGELSADSFSELENMGYPKEMVDTYIKGLQSAQSADSNSVMELAGGQDGYTELTDWARDNMAEAELNVYNQMVESNTDNAKVAVEWLMSRREAAGAVEPNLLSGKSGSPQRDEFRSTAEVVSAMKDPRYHADAAFRKDVEEKLARSSVF